MAASAYKEHQELAKHFTDEELLEQALNMSSKYTTVEVLFILISLFFWGFFFPELTHA